MSTVNYDIADLSDSSQEKLNNLVEILNDSSEGFRVAAEQVKSENLADCFRDVSKTREALATELRSIIRANGAKPPKEGSWKGQVHRWWIEARGAIQSGDNHAILSEVERGEDKIKERYEEVLPKLSGTPVMDLLNKQYRSVKETHDLMRDLRDARKNN